MITARIRRLLAGDYSFGCDGTHRGYGSQECPRQPHHHHDDFCNPPTNSELIQAGIDLNEFKIRSRR
jgi:hypothetical protein